MPDDETTQNLSLDWLISHLRWVWLIIALAIVLLSQPELELQALVVYALLGIGALYNLVIVAMLFIGWYPNWMAIVASLLDTVLGIALLWFTGGHNSFMLPVLLFPVVIMVVRISPASGLLLSALPVTLVYIASIFVSLTSTEANVHSTTVIKTISDLTALFGAGILAGYITREKIKNKAQEDEAVIRRLRIENDRAKVVYKMARTLSSTLNYQKVLRTMVDLAQVALSEANGRTQDASTVGMVLLFEDDKLPLGRLKLVAGRNIPRIDEGTKVSVQEGILAQTIYKAEAIVSNEIRSDPALKQFSALQNCHSMVCAPLRGGFNVYGLVLFASPKKNIYTQEHAALLTTFCNQAAVALQNAQLYEDVEKEQKKLLEQEAQSRRELARNLHDGPTQAIASIAMRLNFVQNLLRKKGDVKKAIEEIETIEEITLKTTKEIRTMLFTLRPVVLETQGLTAAIEQYADRLGELDNLNIKLDLSGYDGQLPTAEEGVIFAIIEEAIGNAKKHAQAETIRIKLWADKETVAAEISDNGTGFDLAAVKSTYDQRGSLGLLNMDERAQLVGGRCTITAAKGKGTIVKIKVPLNRENQG